MNRILRVVFVCIFIVGLTGTYFGCAGSLERRCCCNRYHNQ